MLDHKQTLKKAHFAVKYFVFFSYTVKSHFKALGLYNFKRGFCWPINGGAYIRGGLYPGGLISGIKKLFGNDGIKRI